MRGAGEELAHRRLFDDAAGVHDDDALAELGDDAEVVRDEQDGQAEPLLQRGQELHDLRLDGDVERRGRLVGDEQLGIARQAPWRSSRAGACRRRAGADSRRRRLCGSGIETSSSMSPGLLPRLFLRHLAMDADGLGHLRADLEDRIERRHRLLEDHGDVVAADVAHLALGELGQVASLEADLAAR